MHTGLRAAIGGTVVDIGDLSSSHREATRVLRAMRVVDSPASSVATVADVRSHILLLELQDLVTRQPELREGVVAVLREHDAQRDTEYVKTLRAYLDCFGDVPAAFFSWRFVPLGLWT